MCIDIDKSSRNKIETIIDKNYFVEAGAGSGKTYELVQRMLAMVEKGVDVSKICTITFTKAAANEFYSRFQEALSKSKSEYAKKALKDIDLCFMGTIDAFCSMVLSEHPLEAGIPSDSVVISDEERKKLYKREYSNIQRGYLGTDLKDKCIRFKRYYSNDEDVFVNGLTTLMNIRNAHINGLTVSAGLVDVEFASLKALVTDMLTRIAGKGSLIGEGDKTARASKKLLLENINTLSEPWDDNLGNVMYILKHITGLRIVKEYDPSSGILGEGFDDYFCGHISNGKIKWYELDCEKYSFDIQRLDNYRFAIAMDFISSAVDAISEKLKNEGKLTFYDNLLYLRDVLKEDAGKERVLINHIYNRHSYFLIDEFQDTDPIQSEVFFLITSGNNSSDWKSCIPKPGSLFIVGDPKQSIYRFKNADVTSFLSVKNLFMNSEVGEVLYLTRNFRSSDDMCVWFNSVFKDILLEDTPIQSKYNSIPTGEKPEYKASLKGAYYYDVPYAKKLEDNIEFAKVADIIYRLTHDDDITIQDRGENVSPRNIEYKDIMVITPGKGHLSYFMKAFRLRNIPFKVEGKVVFSECPALVSLSKIFNAIADTYNKGKVFGAEYLSGCDIDKAFIEEFSNAAKNLSPSAAFSKIIDETMLLSHNSSENIEYLYYAEELLRTAQTSGEITSLKEASAYISSLLESSGQERSIQLIRDTNQVHLANLHKVKGLEAPVVILADPSPKKTDADLRVDYQDTPPQSYIFNIGDSSTDEFNEEKEKEEACLAEENKRLQYVAATRAADAIIISSLILKNGVSENNIWYDFRKYTDANFDDTLKDSAEPDPGTEISYQAENLIKEAGDTSVLNEKESENATYGIERPSTIKIKAKSDSDEEDFDPEEAEEIKTKKTGNAALIGTMVHKIMEVLVSSRGACSDKDLIIQILNEYEADSSIYIGYMEKVINTIRNGGYKEDILAELMSADEVFCELPFNYMDSDSKIWNGVMDVVYRKDGKWYIVDYKTDAEIKNIEEKHEEQLNAYIKAFKVLTGEDADARIYHIGV